MWKERLRDDLVFVIHEFLSPEECREFVEIGEAHGFSDAPIVTRCRDRDSGRRSQ